MNITIRRYLYDRDGVFSYMYDDQGRQIAECLERAYDIKGKDTPKVAAGKYTCVRHFPNHLHYETFMLQNVPDFQGEPISGILIHTGNFQKDSSGCFLIGEKSINNAIFGRMLVESRVAFDKFMNLQSKVNEFTLTVEDKSDS